MINAQDLRIGNFVFDNGENLVSEVKEIHSDSLWLFTDEDYPVVQNTILDYYEQLTKDVSGIELTEEWLIKFGFSKIIIANNRHKNVFVKRIHEMIYLEYNFDIKFFELVRHKENKIDIARITIPNKCEWLHDFQNAHKTLTGQELSLTQPPITP